MEQKKSESQSSEEVPIQYVGTEMRDLESPCEDQLSLETLPAEIFLHICSFLNAKFIINSLSQVCSYFNTLIIDNTGTFWKARIGKRWRKKYPAIPVNDAEFDWKEACAQREYQHFLWSNVEENVDYFQYSEGLFASVDCVHLLKEGSLLAAGSRDRYLNVLDLGKLESGNPDSVKQTKVFSKMDAHKGWIWCLSSLDSLLSSGSWDSRINYWDLAAGGELLRSVKCKSAILCMQMEPDFMVAGSYDKNVYHVDPRVATILAEKKYHSRPVLALATDDRYIVTASEDKTVAVYDRRADKVMRTLMFDAFPTSLSYGEDQLWVGDKLGQLHLVDATDGDFNLVESYDVGHKSQMTGVQHTMGAIFTCSTDNTVKVVEPSVKPDVITTLTNQTKAVARMDFRDDVLACAGSNISIGIWRPNSHGALQY